MMVVVVVVVVVIITSLSRQLLVATAGRATGNKQLDKHARLVSSFLSFFVYSDAQWI